MEVSEYENFPVIDLACDDRSLIVRQIRDACRSYGFFQVVNHGVSSELEEEMLRVSREFFRLPVDQEKLKLYKDHPLEKVRLPRSFNGTTKKADNWTECLTLPLLSSS